MTAILRKSYSVFNAANFMNTFGNVTPATTGQALYLAVGRSAEWSPNDAIPETPTSSLTKESEFRKQLLFLKRINPQDIALVIPRQDFDWTHVTAPASDPADQFEIASIDPDVSTPYSARNYYFKTSTNHIWQVTSVPGGVGTTYATPDAMPEPGLPIGDGSISDHAGVTDLNFQYVSSANSLVGTKFLDDNWLPIGYNLDSQWTLSLPSGTISDDQGNFGIVNANGTLSVNHVMISVTLDATFLDIINAIPAEFRQVAIVVGPADINGDPITGDAYGYTTNISEKDIGDTITDIDIDGVLTTTQGDLIAGDGAGTSIPVDGLDVDNSTGELIYMENRLAIIRAPGQSETTKVIIEF